MIIFSLKKIINILHFAKGKSICPHGRVRYRCKDCGGSSFCQHGSKKSTCKDCGGNALCVHKNVKYRCKLCGSKSFCVHGKRKSVCKDCGGSQFCLHGLRKQYCRDCNGMDVLHAMIQLILYILGNINTSLLLPPYDRLYSGEKLYHKLFSFPSFY